MIGRKNFYGSGAQWAAHLAADVWTVAATAQHGIELCVPRIPSVAVSSEVAMSVTRP